MWAGPDGLICVAFDKAMTEMASDIYTREAGLLPQEGSNPMVLTLSSLAVKTRLCGSSPPTYANEVTKFAAIA